ncbi:CHAT domain-containing protein [Dactylosporangium fulvum]|uniref:CHAT domain-containing protein n=1 Tax=Dactylosporangium fulvum TaxID=53359 RepID=A0ABY5W9D1_9ACTN|nr:CHAT domain-containing protein [Dactylosporangium fulvum]UWP86477.1 CHAT domain-containing protein [Dactylosporangium fulvum]
MLAVGAAINDLAEGGAGTHRLVTAVEELAGHAVDDPELLVHVEMLRLTAEMFRAREDRDLATLTALPGRVAELRERVGPDSPYEDDLKSLATLTELMALSATGRPADLLKALPRLLRLKGPPGFATAVPVLGDAFGGTVRDRDLAKLRREAVTGKLSPPERANLLGQLGFVNAKRGADNPALFSVAVLDLRRAVRESPAGDIHRALYLTVLGDTLLQRAVATMAAPTPLRRWLLRPSLRPRAGARADVGEAVAVLEEALDTAGWPGHAFWSMAAVTLGAAYRLAGRPADARDVGLRGLRGHAWRALLQPDTAARTAAVKYASPDAMTVAGWHITDGDAAGAAVALDACRGLILHAATEYADVPTRLAAVGAEELAAQWRAHPGALDEVPIELRRAALQRLTTAGGLLDPPPEAEVRAALTAVGADALVYLVPPDAGPAAAVIVPAAGPPTILPLPRLTTLPGTPATDPAADPARDLAAIVRQPNQLGTLCDWAWDAAIGPLLDTLGTPAPRLVLVPMGELATVPWHAARHVVDGRPEYAIERAVFSYAASARMLCRTADRPATAIEPALVVGDPDTAGAATALPAARDEALAVAGLYRDATYVGRLADGTPSPAGAGTPEEVLGWLADGSAGPGGVLHLACHGVVIDGAGTQDTSYLLLAGGRRLAAERLAATMATHAARRPALVVLAACSSGVSGRGWDEAFSLSTTFLASGAGSVVAAHRSLPDQPTSDLMVLFHRYLLVEGLAPVDALRAAQLAFLDRDVTDWAGVVHYGR